MKQTIDLNRKNRAIASIETLLDQGVVVVSYVPSKFERGDFVINRNTKRICIYLGPAPHSSTEFVAMATYCPKAGMYTGTLPGDYYKYCDLASEEEKKPLVEALAKKYLIVGEGYVRAMEVEEAITDVEAACRFLKEEVPNIFNTYSNDEFESTIKSVAALIILAKAWNRYIVNYSPKNKTRYVPIFTKGVALVTCEGAVSNNPDAQFTTLLPNLVSFRSENVAAKFGTIFEELYSNLI